MGQMVGDFVRLTPASLAAVVALLVGVINAGWQWGVADSRTSTNTASIVSLTTTAATLQDALQDLRRRSDLIDLRLTAVEEAMSRRTEDLRIVERDAVLTGTRLTRMEERLDLYLQDIQRQLAALREELRRQQQPPEQRGRAPSPGPERSLYRSAER